MDAKPLFFRFRLYLLGVGALTLLALLLRTLALLLAFDADIGYFSTDLPSRRFWVYFLYVIRALGIALCCALPLLIRRDELPVGHAPLSKAEKLGAGLCALLFSATAVYLLTQIGSLPCPALLTVLAALCLCVGAIYFALHFSGRSNAAPAFGFGVIFAAVLLLSMTYFDRYTQMNAPHKVGLHLCLLSVMILMIYELRALIGRPMPRALALSRAICFFLCTTVGISNLFAFIARVYTDPLYFTIDLLVTSVAVYVGSRTIADLYSLAPAKDAGEQGAA